MPSLTSGGFEIPESRSDKGDPVKQTEEKIFQLIKKASYFDSSTVHFVNSAHLSITLQSPLVAVRSPPIWTDRSSRPRGYTCYARVEVALMCRGMCGVLHIC